MQKRGRNVECLVRPAPNRTARNPPNLEAIPSNSAEDLAERFNGLGSSAAQIRSFSSHRSRRAGCGALMHEEELEIIIRVFALRWDEDQMLFLKT
jgi:hypothetical protein